MISPIGCCPTLEAGYTCVCPNASNRVQRCPAAKLKFTHAATQPAQPTMMEASTTTDDPAIGKVKAPSAQQAHHEEDPHTRERGPRGKAASAATTPTRRRRREGAHDACATAQWSNCTRACPPRHTAEARPLAPLASASAHVLSTLPLCSKTNPRSGSEMSFH